MSNPSRREPLDVALAGCGAIAQTAYLPAFASVKELRCRFLVDANQQLAQDSAKQWRVGGIATDLRSVVDQVEAVIVAVPNHLQAPLSLLSLEHGKAVLCEKPLARTVSESLTMVEAAERVRVPLMAAMIMRQYVGLSQVRESFPHQELGEVREVNGCYGVPLDWPSSSLALFDREKSGGGALIDLGVHLLDALFWALSVSSVEVLEYADDNAGGMEAEARGRLLIGLASRPETVPFSFQVSRLRRLSNCLRIVGERASLHVSLADQPARVSEVGGGDRILGQESQRNWQDCFADQLRQFSAAVRGEPSNLAGGESQITVLETVEACYGRRKSLGFPWLECVR